MLILRATKCSRECCYGCYNSYATALITVIPFIIMLLTEILYPPNVKYLQHLVESIFPKMMLLETDSHVLRFVQKTLISHSCTLSVSCYLQNTNMRGNCANHLWTTKLHRQTSEHLWVSHCSSKMLELFPYSWYPTERDSQTNCQQLLAVDFCTSTTSALQK